MALLERSFTGNKPLMLASQMKWKSLGRHFWGKFAKFTAPGDQVTINPGNDPQPTESPVVLQHELERNQGDVMMIPCMRNLDGLPVYGKDQLEGREESQKMNFATIPIDLIRWGVKPVEGVMSEQTTKDYRLLQRAYPQLQRHYAEQEEFLQMTYGMYYGFSRNILLSSRFTGNSQNIKAISHPNIFIIGQGRVESSGVYCGTTAYENLVAAGIDAINSSNKMSVAVLDAMASDEQVRVTTPLIMKDSNPLWFWVMPPYMIRDLEADDKFRNMAASTLAQNYAKDNPFIVGAKYIQSGFAIFDSSTVCWPMSTATSLPVWGVTSPTGLSSYRSYSSYTSWASIIFGQNAIFKAYGRPLEFKKREADFGEIQAIAYRTIEGASRGDFWNEDDGTRGDAIVNDGSILVLGYAAKPSLA